MRRILVTGAGGGIGGATADELARLGAHVYCADLDAARAGAAAQRTGGTAVVLDVSDLDAAERAVRAATSRLDGIVHAAGIGPRTAFPEVDEAEWARVLDVNLSAPFLLTQRLLDVLVDGGSIVNVTSAAAANVLATSGVFTPSVLRREGGVRVGDGLAGGGARPARHPRQRGRPGLHRDGHDGALRRRHEGLDREPDAARKVGRGGRGGEGDRVPPRRRRRRS